MKKKIPVLACLSLISILIPSVSGASNIERQYVDDVMVANWGHAFITFTPGSRADIPACGSNYPNRYVIDASTPAGQSQLSNILTAFAMGRPVTVNGTGDCGVFSNTETAKYIWVYRQ